MFPQVEFIMHLKHENVGYKIEKPDGNGFYTFFHFINPVKIMIDGRMIHTLPGVCCIFSPDYPQCIEADRFPLLHDYVCFSCDGDFPIKQVNKLLYINNTDEISAAVEDIQYNFNNHTLNPEDYKAAVRKGIEWLFHDINQFLDKQASSSVASRSDALMKKIRQDMYANVSEWNVDRMIIQSNFSRPQFYRKYRELFGIAPNDDIICAAMLKAENLLIFSDIPVFEISYEIGYSSVDYFIRCFKKHYGMSPGKFRELNKKE